MIPLNSGKSYHYTLLWVVAYPLMALSFLFIANENPFTAMIHKFTFYTDLLFAVVVTFGVGLYVQRITQYLDQRFSWQERFRLRLLNQALIGVLLPLLFSMGLEVVYLFLIHIPLRNSSILNLELPLTLVFLVLVNMFYLAAYLYRHINTRDISEQKTVTPIAYNGSDYIIVQKGFSEIKVNRTECAYINSANKLLWLCTFAGETYRLNGTLDEWEERLKDVGFYRLNRQYIAAHKAISSMEQTHTRKLKINFVIPTPDVYVSKLNAAGFRHWWKTTGTL